MGCKKYRLLVDHSVAEQYDNGEPTGRILTAKAGDVFEQLCNSTCGSEGRFLQIVDGCGDVFWMVVSLDTLRSKFEELEC